jgi:hypothetical protein
MARLLDTLVDLLIGMPSQIYSARPLAEISGSIGAHVRHSLDHIGALLASDPSARFPTTTANAAPQSKPIRVRRCASCCD